MLDPKKLSRSLSQRGELRIQGIQEERDHTACTCGSSSDLLRPIRFATIKSLMCALLDTTREKKSPLLMSNKKDYQRVLQSHEQLFLKVEASMRRCQKAEMEREVAAKGRDRIEQELEVTKK